MSETWDGRHIRGDRTSNEVSCLRDRVRVRSARGNWKVRRTGTRRKSTLTERGRLGSQLRGHIEGDEGSING
jgi:hypothetical protein